MRQSTALVAPLLVALLATSGCTEDAPVPAAATASASDTASDTTLSSSREGLLSLDASPFPGGRPFSDNSPFNTPLPSDPPIHPNSEAIIAAMAEREPATIVLSVDEWTVGAYLAGPETRRGNVRLTVDWAPFGLIEDVPMPGAARPDPAEDGSLAVIDSRSGYVYDFWEAQTAPEGWQASWGNRIAVDSDGVYPHGFSARGSGFSLLAGLIWPHELAAGKIEHALLFSYEPVRGGVLAPPATENDGTWDDPLTLPEGARLQLDPAFDVDGMDAPESVKTIARAMQQYGMILGDSAGTSVVELEFVHPWSFGYESGAALFEAAGIDMGLDDVYAEIWQIPLSTFRVIDFDEIPLDGLAIEVADESIYREPREVD